MTSPSEELAHTTECTTTVRLVLSGSELSSVHSSVPFRTASTHHWRQLEKPNGAQRSPHEGTNSNAQVSMRSPRCTQLVLRLSNK